MPAEGSGNKITRLLSTLQVGVLIYLLKNNAMMLKGVKLLEVSLRNEIKVKKALTIAGSDSGGGAGIQADIKTFAALGVYGSSVIAALTAQNTLGVQGVSRISADFVGMQLDSVLADIGADAVKTGMLYDAEIIEVITEKLKIYKIPSLVVDPVMVASSGSRLLNQDAVRVMRDKLLPITNSVTPNVEEASALCGVSINTEEDVYKASREIKKMGPDFVIITGIKRDKQCIDLCYDGNEFRELTEPIFETQNTHGTGCSFSAALTAALARGVSSWQAVSMAKDFVANGLCYSYRVGSGHSPINHFASFFPGRLDDIGVKENRAHIFQDWEEKPKLGPFPLLNVIIGGPLCKGKDYAELTQAAIEGGARLIQLREKKGDTRQLVETAKKMHEVCRKNNALLVINDRVDVAAAAGADGVHLGQDDLSLRMARAILGPEKIIGISVDNLAQAETAVSEGADYLGFGPAYSTDTKECKRPAGGPSLIAQVALKVKIPVLAIGGVTPENTLQLLKAGASGVAVISSVLGSPNPKQVVQKFIEIFNAHNK